MKEILHFQCKQPVHAVEDDLSENGISALEDVTFADVLNVRRAHVQTSLMKTVERYRVSLTLHCASI